MICTGMTSLMSQTGAPPGAACSGRYATRGPRPACQADTRSPARPRTVLRCSGAPVLGRSGAPVLRCSGDHRAPMLPCHLDRASLPEPHPRRRATQIPDRPVDKPRHGPLGRPRADVRTIFHVIHAACQNNLRPVALTCASVTGDPSRSLDPRGRESPVLVFRPPTTPWAHDHARNARYAKPQGVVRGRARLAAQSRRAADPTRSGPTPAPAPGPGPGLAPPAPAPAPGPGPGPGLTPPAPGPGPGLAPPTPGPDESYRGATSLSNSPIECGCSHGCRSGVSGLTR